MLIKVPSLHMGFPGGSVGKESACNAGDPSSIPVSGRSTGEGEGICLGFTLCVVCAIGFVKCMMMRILHSGIT